MSWKMLERLRRATAAAAAGAGGLEVVAGATVAAGRIEDLRVESDV